MEIWPDDNVGSDPVPFAGAASPHACARCQQPPEDVVRIADFYQSFQENNKSAVRPMKRLKPESDAEKWSAPRAR